MRYVEVPVLVGTYIPDRTAGSPVHNRVSVHGPLRRYLIGVFEGGMGGGGVGVKMYTRRTKEKAVCNPCFWGLELQGLRGVPCITRYINIL